jgi:hypothetical protein
MRDRQHFLPAALLGGFGRPNSRRKGARYAAIAVRDLATREVRISNAESEAHRRALYRLAAPPPGIDRDAVDELWDSIEPGLPDLIARVEGYALIPGDDSRLLDYAASVWVRHPSFAVVAADHQVKSGQPAPSSDAVQIMRVEGLLNQRKTITDWRWRVLHACPDAPRFVISDLGFIGIADSPEGDAVKGLLNAVFVPLSPMVGLLAYLDHPALPPRRQPFTEHRDVVPSWVFWLNACATSTGRGTLIEPRAVFGHPDDEEMLRTLPAANTVRPNPAGPFRGVGMSSVTLLD